MSAAPKGAAPCASASTRAGSNEGRSPELICAAIGLAYGGIEGAAAGCLVGTVLAALGALIYAAGWLELPIHFGAYLRIFASVCAMLAALLLTPEPQTGLAIGLNILLGIVVYGACMFALFPQVRR